MITVHNLTKNGVAKPIRSTIIKDSHLDEKTQEPKDAIEGWQAYSGKSTITWPSPTAVNEDATKSAGHLKDANMDLVNRARYCDIAIGTGADDLSRVVAKTGNTYLLSASAFGNWRKRDINCFTDISQRVMLQMDERPSPNYSVKYTTSSVADVVLKSKLANTVSKISDAVNTFALTAGALTKNEALAEAAITGERASLYQNFPVFELAKTETNANPGDVKFTFRFGQAGLFSGEEEVVKPILALIGPWVLKTGDYHSIIAPYPTISQVSRKAVLETIKLIGGNGGLLEQDSDALKDKKNSDKAASMLTGFNNFTDALYKLVDDIAEECFKTTTTVTFIMGGLVQGPFVCKSISWGFDFDNVDEFGYPCEGWVKMDNLEPIRMYVNGDYARQWGYDVNLVNSKNTVNIAQASESALDKKETMAEATGAKEV